VQYERKQYFSGMILTGGDCPAEFDSTVHKSARPSPVKHDAAAEALAAFEKSAREMQAIGRRLSEIQERVKAEQARQRSEKFGTGI
jgi:hypothetical protein